MKKNLLVMLNLFLIVLFIAIFSLAFYFNQSYKDNSIRLLLSSLQKTIQEQKKTIVSYLEQQKEMLSDVSKNRNSLAQACLTDDIYFMKNGKIVPANVKPDLINNTGHLTVSEATRLLTQGLKIWDKGDTRKALEVFNAAVDFPVYNGSDLYQKVSIYMNILEINNYKDMDALTQTLFLLFDFGEAHLNDSQINFFEAVLIAKIPDYLSIKNRCHTLWVRARKIEKKVVIAQLQPIGFMDNSLYTMNKDGMIFLLPFDWEKNVKIKEPVQISWTKPDPPQVLLIEQLMDDVPLYFWVAKQDYQLQYEFILRQHRINIFILLFMGIGSIVLLFGVNRMIKRENDFTQKRMDFITSVSHEIRTPLALIYLYIETLFYKRISEKKKKDYYHNILSETERMSALLNNILDFSRIEKGEKKMSLETVDISELCSKAAKSFSFRFAKEKVVINTKIARNIIVQTDKIALSQILFNLIDNAVKYSLDRKEIGLDLELQGSECIIHVSDFGIGIPNPLKEKIFEDFYRVDDKRVSAQRGSGIGLSITRKLVESLHGKIEVTDNKPQGTVFKVILPLMQEESRENTYLR